MITKMLIPRPHFDSSVTESGPGTLSVRIARLQLCLNVRSRIGPIGRQSRSAQPAPRADWVYLQHRNAVATEPRTLAFSPQIAGQEMLGACRALGDVDSSGDAHVGVARTLTPDRVPAT